MIFGLGSFSLINEFERASNEPNVEQLASSSARLQPYEGVLFFIYLFIFLVYYKLVHSYTVKRLT